MCCRIKMDWQPCSSSRARYQFSNGVGQSLLSESISRVTLFTYFKSSSFSSFCSLFPFSLVSFVSSNVKSICGFCILFSLFFNCILFFNVRRLFSWLLTCVTERLLGYDLFWFVFVVIFITWVLFLDLCLFHENTLHVDMFFGFFFFNFFIYFTFTFTRFTNIFTSSVIYLRSINPYRFCRCCCCLWYLFRIYR